MVRVVGRVGGWVVECVRRAVVVVVAVRIVIASVIAIAVVIVVMVRQWS